MENMNETMLTAKGAISAFFMAISAFLGWKGILAAVWVGAMALDYISGTAAACREGRWYSAVARQGLWHKGGMILIVIVAAAADGVFGVVLGHLPLGITWPGLLLPLILSWYIITELGSILENAVKLGAKVPEWFVKLMKTSLKAVNEAGEAAAGNMEETEHEP